MDPEQLRRLQAEAWLAERDRARQATPEGQRAAAERARVRQLESDNSWAIGESLGGYAGAIPVVGEVLNGASAVYHTGSAVYDGIHGDRDGAVAHGTQAAYSAIGVIPGVSEALGTADLVGNTLGLAGRVAVSGRGMREGDASQVPGGISDALAAGAVTMTNAVFGADDDNWIAEGDAPTGTRGGEINAGFLGIPGLLGVDDDLGRTFGADVDGPTSGARSANGEGNWAQEAGDAIHEAGLPIAQELMRLRGPAPAGRIHDAVQSGIDDVQGNVVDGVQRGQNAIDRAQLGGTTAARGVLDSVADVSQAGQNRVAGATTNVRQRVAGGQARVDAAQATANRVVSIGNNAVDDVQTELGLSSTANNVIDRVQGAGNDMVGVGQGAVDNAQRVAGRVVAGGTTLVDRGAQVVGGAVDSGVAAGHRVVDGIGNVVDAGQRTADRVVRTGSNAVDAAQHRAAQVYGASQHAAQTVWSWVTD